MTRPWTDDVVTTKPDGRTSTTVTVKRACNGCHRQIGDASDEELDAAMNGQPLPDVRDECGCEPTEASDQMRRPVTLPPACVDLDAIEARAAAATPARVDLDVAEERLIDRRCRCGRPAVEVHRDCAWHDSVSAKYAADLLAAVRSLRAENAELRECDCSALSAAEAERDELRADYERIAATASDVYCDITGGLLSYPTYDAQTILFHANDCTQKLVDEEVERETADLRARLAASERFAEHERRKAEDFEARCETSHASRMHAEGCFRRAERRCNAIGHPTVTPESLIPCQLDIGHDGDHYSTSGCAGGAVHWPSAERQLAAVREVLPWLDEALAGATPEHKRSQATGVARSILRAALSSEGGTE